MSLSLFTEEWMMKPVENVPSSHVKACSCTTRAGQGWEISAALDGEKNLAMDL